MAQILDITLDNFETTVMKASAERAVVVSFFSTQVPECAPYEAILEKLSKELDFTLGKVNLDQPENEAFIRSFQIRSLPDVRVLSQGEMADVIQGVLPEDKLKERLGKFFMTDEARALQAIEDPILEKRFEEAKPALDAGLSKNPSDKHLLLLLAQTELGLGNSEQAKTILTSFQEGDEGYLKAKSLLELMEFHLEAAKSDIQGEEAIRFHEACVFASKEEYREALQAFLSLVREFPDWNNSRASKAMLTLFNVLGAKHALTWEFRAKLNNTLFV